MSEIIITAASIAADTKAIVDAKRKLGKAVRGFQRRIVTATFNAAKGAESLEAADKARKAEIGKIKAEIFAQYSDAVVEFVEDSPEKGENGLREFCKAVEAQDEDGVKIARFDLHVYYLVRRMEALNARANDVAPLLECMFIEGGQAIIDEFFKEGRGVAWVKEQLAKLQATNTVGEGEGEGDAEGEGDSEMTPEEKFEHLLETALTYGAKNVEGFEKIAMERIMARVAARV